MRAGRRLLPAAVLLALAALAAAPAAAQTTFEVAPEWPLAPSGITERGESFRLLFVTSSGRKADSSDIGDYNGFVANAAKGGHTAIRPYSSHFRVVGSTNAVDARDNTSTTYTATDKGVAIYWLNGSQVADDYEDFYDGSWDEKINARLESGRGAGRVFVWTGSNANGTAHDRWSLGNDSGHNDDVWAGLVGDASGHHFQQFGFNGGTTHRLYALSPVFKIRETVGLRQVSYESAPADAMAGYAAGETITVRVTFTEEVNVTGTPHLFLNVGGAARKAVYSAGSGTPNLDFTYTVQAADFDSDGVKLCESTSLDPGCGRIRLGGGSILSKHDGLAPASLDLPRRRGPNTDHRVDGTPMPFTPMPGTGTGMVDASTGDVPSNWALLPSGVERGRKFRLLFRTSTTHTAESDSIATYNAIVQTRAGLGHTAIRAFKGGFGAVGCTATGDAVENTGTAVVIGGIGDEEEEGVPIFWLNGSMVADGYADFYLPGWTNQGSARNESGQSAGTAAAVFTGCRTNGRATSYPLGSSEVTVGSGTGTGNPFDTGDAARRAATETLPLYALSQALMANKARVTAMRRASAPAQAGTFIGGETIAVEVTFSEKVAVRGAPQLGLLVGNAADTLRQAEYVSGSGTAVLRFEYVVRIGDHDGDGYNVVNYAEREGPFQLDGATVRAVTDGSDVSLAWKTPLDGGAEHKVEARPPTVTGVSIASSPPSGDTYGVGETVTVRLAMREAVRVTGTPHVWLNVGGAARRADYAGPVGEATESLDFSYTVQAGDFDGDGVAICSDDIGSAGCGRIHLNGGTVRAAGRGQDALLAHPTQSAQSGHKVDGMPVSSTGDSAAPACPVEIRVPSDWTLKPSGVAAGGKFRLLFITSNTRNGQSRKIGDYNSFVQNRAGAGHSAIRAYKSGFRVLASTSSVDARDNTCTTGAGVRIHWLNSVKVADNYGDFYDGAWDDLENRRTENGSRITSFVDMWTGSESDGTGKQNAGLGDRFPIRVRIDAFENIPGGGGPVGGGGGIGNSNNNRLYGLSQVFVVDSSTDPGPSASSISIVSMPAIGDTYRRGETVLFEVTFSEAVTVRGSPVLNLALGDNGAELANSGAGYLRGSGTRKLVFGYTVRSDDSDDDGIETAAAPVIRLEGAAIAAASDGVAANFSGLAADTALQPGHKIDGALGLPAGAMIVSGVSFESAPADAMAGYAAGETITVRVTFTESVNVTGTPFVYLNIGGVVRKAAYASGSGTAALEFGYRVQAADFDSDGVSLCSNETLDRGCGRIGLDGGSIEAALDEVVPSLALPALDDQADHKVDGTPMTFTPMPGAGTVGAPTGEVPSDWSLKPSGVGRAKGFRLLFITTGKRDATASDIATYNTFVQNAVGAGHTDIRAYKSGFRALASTEAVDARDNTGTTGTGVPVYWLNGNRLADDYADLYDGTWDDVTNRKNENGNAESDVSVWTGSSDDGTEAHDGQYSYALGSTATRADAMAGRLGSGQPLSGEILSQRLNSRPLYGLSQVLMAPALRVTALRVVSRPASGDTYRIGETLALAATFGEKVRVRGTPRIALQVGERAVAARYASGSGTAVLRFEYALRAGDRDPDGFDIAMDADRAGPFRLDGSTIRAVWDNADADLAWETSLAGANRLVDTDPLKAQSVSIVSSPASGDTYGVGETVTVRLGFGGQVRVTGKPHVWLNVGGAARRADYAGPAGEATESLDFSYTVQAGDFDGDGVAICSDAVGSAGCGRIHLNGGTIRAVTDGRDIGTGHPTQSAQSGHKVDGMPVFSTGDTAAPACPVEIRVPSDWSLKPSGVAAGGKFRLLFITSNTSNARSSKIGDYNSYVQNRAGAGHSAIRAYKPGFRALGSTSSVDARDNTCTTGAGVRIHWLNSVKAADNYGDFYDGDWDDLDNRRYENGSRITGFVDMWTGSESDGTGRQNASLGDGRAVSVRITGLDEVSGQGGPVGGGGTTRNSDNLRLYGLSQVFVVDSSADPGPSASAVSIVSTPALGDTYRRGETVLFEVTFSEAVTVRGTPQLAIGPKNRDDPYHGHIRPSYVYGSGTTKLVFGYTVRSGDSDDDGLDTVDAPVIRLEGATIAAASDGAAANISGLAAYTRLEPRHKIDGALAPATGGVCGRSAAVRDWIVETVKVFDPTVSDCRGVTVRHLRLIDGAHTISGAVSLKAGDFEELTGLDGLTLSAGTLASVPARAFEGLSRTGLTSLTITGTRLAALPKDTFRGLRALTALDLSGNELAAGSLPDGVFETLTKLTSLDLSDNPGSATFRPSADAGTGRAMSTGETVTLGGDGTSAGPWGSNVQYEWVQTDAAGDAASVATLSASDVPRPTMTAPAQAEEQSIRLVLTVKGRPFGTADFHSEPSTAEYTIRPLAVSEVAITSAPQASDTYRAGEAIEVSVTFSEPVEVDTSGGGLTIGLGMGTDTANRIADYVRQSGPARLVFSYTVASGDSDSDGVAVPADAIAFAGGNVTNRFGGAALLGHGAVAADAKHQVDGGLGNALTGGVCGRTAQVRDALVAAAQANRPAAQAGRPAPSDCMKVDTTDLAGITTLTLTSKDIGGLKDGDFAGLSALTSLRLDDNALTALPAGVFDGLGALKVLNLTHNDLGPGGLPDGVFEPLGNLVELHLDNNPGSASFLPSADAGADRTVGAGAAVTLGGPGTAGGPWGGNLVYRWTEVDAGGNAAAAPAVDLADLNGERTLEFDAPSHAGETVLRFRLTVTGRGAAISGTRNRFAAEDTAAVTVGAAPSVTRLAIASLPQAGDTYRAGEAIEVAAIFSEAVTVAGAPRVTLKVGAGSRTAAYLRGSGTRTLLFAWTVAAADMDPDGVEIAANALVHGVGAIANAHGGLAVLGHDAVAADAKHKVNGGLGNALTGGVCGRTAQVRDELLRLARANDPAVTDCMKVDATALAGITGVLRLGGKGIAALKAGDFAGLSGVTNLTLNDNALTELPAGVFNGLSGLTDLWVPHNDLAAGSLADGVFQPLAAMTGLNLSGNPGSATFLPSADAGADRMVGAGEEVTPGGAGTGGGPWGTNVEHEWTEVDAEGAAVDPPTVTLTGKDTATASFSAPALSEETVLYFRLAVQGRGHNNSDAFTATDTVKVTVGAQPAVTRLAIASLPQADDTYRAGEAVEVAATFSAPVTVTGAPRVTLEVGAGTRTAAYLRGSGTRTLLFAWTVATAADMDPDGVEIAANALALNGGTIANAHGGLALLGHDAVAADAKHQVDGDRDPALTGGVCGRTAQVRDALVAAAQANRPAAQAGRPAPSDCMKVDTTDLAEITGVLRLGGKGIAALKAEDFAGLSGVTNLTLNDNALTELPAGVFNGLSGLTDLWVPHNDLAAGSLADGVFQPLAAMTGLNLSGNPGSATFLPGADAGADRTVGARAAVTVGVAGTGGGPWGTNVTHTWAQVDAEGNAVDPPTVELTDGGTATASFSAPALVEETVLYFRLAVQGRGHNNTGAHTAEDTVAVTVRAGPAVTGVAFSSAAKIYLLGETIEATVRFGEKVSVKGAPVLTLDVGGTDKEAAYARGGGTAALVFAWTVAAGDVDTDGIAVRANALSTPGASDIGTAAGDRPVALGHKRVRPDRTRQVDGALPAPVSAEVGGSTLTVTFGEALDEASVPAAPGGFTVAVGATDSRTVTGVAVSGKTVVLTLARGIAADTADVTVSYTPPSANQIRDLPGNAAAKFDDLPVTAVQVPNEPATGTVTVSGMATVGQTLTAAVSNVADPDRLHAPPGYAYRWYRIDGGTETKISGAESKTYTLVPADAGKRIRVKASFDDFLNNPETLQSDPYPEFERVMWPDSACATPTAIANGTRTEIWTAEVGVTALTVGGSTVAYGFDQSSTLSSLSDKTFRLGTSVYTVDVLVVRHGATDVGTLRFSTTGDLPATAVTGLALHVCHQGYAFDGASGFEGNNPSYNSTGFTYDWSSSGLDWSGHATRRVWLSRADTTAPVLEKAVVNGATLTLTYGEKLKVASPAAGGSDAVFTVTVGGSPAAVSNVQAGVGPGKRNVTMTLAPAAGFGQAVVAAHYPSRATAATRVQDPAGNEAAGFLRTDALTPAVPLENRTPDAPRVVSVAFAGEAGPYGPGDAIEVEVTFNEAVTVTGTPEIALEIGAETRKARWKAGQAAGTAHRFAYTVAAGDTDDDGIAVVADSLALAGGTIVTADDGETVLLRHVAESDAARTVDTAGPAPVSAEAAGAVLTVTFGEALDEASVPSGAGGFAVAIGASGTRRVTGVAVSGKTVVLTLARGIAADTADVTVDYAPPGTNPIRDLLGNKAAAFEDLAVTAVLVPNEPATGTVTVSGTATVGQTLTVAVSNVSDPAGLHAPPGYAYLWYRIDGTTETPIPGAESKTYTLAAPDAGKRIRVKVSFDDFLDNPETLQSGPYPEFERVMWPDSACATPAAIADGTREQIWTAEVGVKPYGPEEARRSYGYGSDNAGSTLSDKTFPLGTGYTVKALAVGVQGSLGFSTTTDLPATAVTGLALHVCGDTFHFDDGPDADTNADATYSSTGFSYIWSSSGLDWSGHATRRVWLSRADTAAPVLETAVVNGATLTLTYGEKLKVASPAASGSNAVFTVTVGGSPAAVSNVQAGVGPGKRDVTMTLSPAAGFGQAVVAAYTPANATAATRVQDPAGNEAAGFLRTDALTPAVPLENRTPDAPRVVSVAFAGEAGPYGLGDTIEVEVTFNEAVRVTGTPEIGLEIGTATKKARWKAGQAAGTVHRFAYTVAAGDADGDGVTVAADSLALAGGTIVTADDGETVLLGHGAQSDAARTVDTAAPAPLPTDAASASGAVLTVTFGEPLDETSVPAGAGGFTVQGGGNPAVTEVAVSGTGVTLSLSEAIPDGATGVTVSYKKPAADPLPLRDLAGNEAADFSGKAVAVQPDVTAPSLKAQPEGASVNGDRLTLVYDEPLDEDSVPAGRQFTLAVTRAGATVPGYTASTVAVTGSTVVLTLSAAVRHGDIVTVSYTAPSANPIRDRAGIPNPAATFPTPRAVENLTGVPMLELSEAAATEGADRQVALTLTSGGTAFAADRIFTVAAEAGATALETEDWTLSSASVTLKAGATEATAVVTVVDDARLEGEETVAFTATLEGVKSAARTLTVADNDRARLVVEAPEQATEGEAIALKLRLVPVSVPAGQTVADDACILDFPVDAVLAVSGTGAEAALPAGATLVTNHTFAASAFDDCTREIAVGVATRAPDGTYTPPRMLSFALAPAAGADPRILAGEEPAPVTVRDDTIPPGPVVTAVAVTPEPAGATAGNDGPTFRLSEIQALGTGNRAHGPGQRVEFTLTFDQPVTVTGKPELVLGLFHRERRAGYRRGSGTDTLTFRYTVQTGDIDPDGLEVKRLVVPAGATLKDMTADTRPFVAESFPATAPKTRFPRHKVYGGLHGIRLVAGGTAREGEAYSFSLVRDGGYEEDTYAVVTVTDSAFPDIPAGASVPIDGPLMDGPGARVLEFDLEKAKVTSLRRVSGTVTPPGDGARPAERTLTITLAVTDVEIHEPESGPGRLIYEPRGPVTVTVRVLDRGVAAARAGVVTAVAGLPTVTEPGDDGVFAEGERIVAEVAFDGPVTVDTAEGSPVLGLALGGVRREAAYESGSGTAVLSFAYTAVEDDDGAGQARAIANGLVLNGATIRGEDGTDAVLEFGAAPGVASVRIVPPGSDGGSGAGSGGTAGDGAWDPGEALEVALVFEEPVTVETSGGTPTVDVLLGSAAKRAAYVRGSGTDRLVFAYTLAEADGRATSALVPADTLALDGGAIRSTAGLDATLGHPGAGYAGALRGPRAALPVLSVADAAAAEGGTLAFTVTLTPVASGEVTVDWATADGPSPNGATAGSDYTAASGTLTFAAGETRKTVEVAVTADDAEETPETLTLTLSNPSGARLGDGEATGTVSDPGAAPLTGSFSGAPAEHDGSAAFTVTLTFSEEPAGLSYRTVRDALFTVTGATLKQARRLEPPSNERYELTLTPGGNAPVTLALAALPACGEAGSVCTADGRALAGPLTVTVPGPAALSVADASVTEGPGAVLEFAITLDRARHAAVTVDYATSDGPSPKGAVAGSDYTAASGTLTFAAGETGKTVPVAVLDDSHDEGSETMTFTLSNASGARIADGEATGTIDNSDAIPKAWIARFGRTVAEQVLDAVEGRMRGSRTPGAEVSLAGERIGGAASGDVEALERREAEHEARRLSDWLKGETDPEAGRPESRSVAPRDLLTGSSFALTMETARKREFVSLWGRGAVSRFDGRDGDLSLDGEVVSGMLGADWTRDRWSAGLIVSHSRGEGGYSGLGSGAGAGAGGKVTATLTGVFPWARHALSDRVEAWGAAGYGAGELTVTPRKPETGDGDGDGAAMRADLDLKMAAAGLRGVILDPGSGFGAGAGIGLTAKTDALVVQTASGRGRGADGGNLEPARATVTRLRLGLEASRPVRLGGEATLTPSLEVGVRHDGGDAETGFGLDLGGGLTLSDPKRGLQAELRGRGLLTHESKGFRERGFSGSLAWQQKPGSDRGAKLTLTQTVGGSSSGGADALLGRGTLEGLAANDDGGGDLESRRLELKLGYGFSAFGDRFTMTPEVGAGLSDTGRDYRLGWRLVRRSSGGDVGSLELAAEATRRESANDNDAEHGIGLRLTARW